MKQLNTDLIEKINFILGSDFSEGKSLDHISKFYIVLYIFSYY